MILFLFNKLPFCSYLFVSAFRISYFFIILKSENHLVFLLLFLGISLRCFFTIVLWKNKISYIFIFLKILNIFKVLLKLFWCEKSSFKILAVVKCCNISYWFYMLYNKVVSKRVNTNLAKNQLYTWHVKSSFFVTVPLY